MNIAIINNSNSNNTNTRTSLQFHNRPAGKSETAEHWIEVNHEVIIMPLEEAKAARSIFNTNESTNLIKREYLRLMQNELISDT